MLRTTKYRWKDFSLRDLFLFPILLNDGQGLYIGSTTISLCTWSTVDIQNNDKILQLYIVEKARHVIIIMSLHQRILQTNSAGSQDFFVKRKRKQTLPTPTIKAL